MNNPEQPVRDSQHAMNEARSAFEFARGEFRATEDEFLATIDKLWASDESRLRNLATLEGLRMQLMESFNSFYRHTVNNLVEALFASIGEPPHHHSDAHPSDARASDGHSSDGHHADGHSSDGQSAMKRSDDA